MNRIEYNMFYEMVGNRNGWDFSSLQVTHEGIEWNFYEEVMKKSRKTDVLLDIGAGGGESLLPIVSSLLFTVGIDISSSMVETAKNNVAEANLANVRFFQMSSNDIQFPDDFFDVISCRHAPFNSSEIARVLRDGGIFLTQQVSEADKLNIKEAFGRGQSYGETDGTLKEKYIRELKEVGFSKVQSFEYNAASYYHRTEDLIFLLKHTPIIPGFGQSQRDFDMVHHFIEDNRTEKGIFTNTKRFILIAEM
ncbi:class I SAM-dependent methyltransferase [Oceanobacillus luteolus]|uniref:class I SAM-dependent methyltransferase n=1 Tax=Oceanobacillus luteolus TaxID=1274358 RepID=UPI00203B2E04|nr:class I SAM-dependent methyltransferase [Oceanobacillus luteolus]MCM3742420.1 class I SAM-dependent methyltransferase [Oceanobacillus luteolus]